MDLYCTAEDAEEGDDLIPKNKRLTIHRKKNGRKKKEDDDDNIDESDDIPADVKKVIKDIEMEDDGLSDHQPDEQQLEVLEDIWLKAGEMGKYQLNF